MSGWDDWVRTKERVPETRRSTRDFRSGPSWGSVTPGVGDNFDRARGNERRRDGRPSVPDRRTKPGERRRDEHRERRRRDGIERRHGKPAQPKPNGNFRRLPRPQFAMPALPLKVASRAFRRANWWLNALDVALTVADKPMVYPKLMTDEQMFAAGGWTLTRVCNDHAITHQEGYTDNYGTSCYVAQAGGEPLGSVIPNWATGIAFVNKSTGVVQRWYTVKGYTRPRWVPGVPLGQPGRVWPEMSPVVRTSTGDATSWPVPPALDPEVMLPGDFAPNPKPLPLWVKRPVLDRVPSQSRQEGYGEGIKAKVDLSVVSVGQTIVITPGGAVVAPGIPGPGKPNPPVRPGEGGPVVGRPPRGTKERKVHARNMAPGLWNVANMASEAADFVEAFHDALPPKYRSKDASTAQMLEDLYRHWDKVDMSKALTNLIMNEAKDWAIGKLSQSMLRQWRRTHRGPMQPLVSPQTGWAL